VPKKSGPGYPGILKRRIRRQELRGVAPSTKRAALTAAAASLEKVYGPRFLKLFSYHGINPKDPDAWMRLAVSLAVVHVPGFRIEHPAGAKLFWTDERLAQLFADVEVLRKRKFKVARACQKLASDERYRERYEGCSDATLRRCYMEARNLLIKASHPRAGSSSIAKLISLLRGEGLPADDILIKAFGLPDEEQRPDEPK
jgi:hypothetical protein